RGCLRPRDGERHECRRTRDGLRTRSSRSNSPLEPVRLDRHDHSAGCLDRGDRYWPRPDLVRGRRHARSLAGARIGRTPGLPRPRPSATLRDPMRDLSERSLDTAVQLGASYADVRVVRRRDESIAIKTGRVEGVASGESEGFGVRVIVDGAWGFASSHVLGAAEADRVAAEAVRIARSSATALRHPTELDHRPPAHGRYETPLEIDPFEVPLETKIADLLAADQAATAVKGIAFTESSYAAQREWKTFAATDGSLTE